MDLSKHLVIFFYTKNILNYTLQFMAQLLSIAAGSSWLKKDKTMLKIVNGIGAELVSN